MTNGFSDVRNRFEAIRFAGDKSLDSFQLPGHETLKIASTEFSFHNLRVTRRITPKIYKAVQRSFEALGVLEKDTEVFVYGSSDVQAQCLPSSTDLCVLRLSSGLVSLLSLSELRFVIGHELAHHIYQHGSSQLHSEQMSLEEQLGLKYREISADRIGLLASGSLRDSVSALLKTASGLDSEHLRIDIQEYLNQLNDGPNEGLRSSGIETHPPLLIRCRAILWFSGCIGASCDIDALKPGDLDRIDRNVQRDLDRFIDAPVSVHREGLVSTYALWIFLCSIVDSGKFSKNEQKAFDRAFGQQRLSQVKRFLSATPTEEINSFCAERRETTLNAIKSDFPRSWRELAQAAEELVSEAKN